MRGSAEPREVLELAGGEVVLEHDVGIPVRDGLRLSADVYRPNREGRFPALLEHIPYRKDDLEAGDDRENGIYLARQGLASVRLDVRGTGNSEGIARDEYTAEEQRDGVEAVGWIAEQPWCTGKVGSWGTSYGGFACIQLAALRPPALAAIAPIYATDDRYTDDMHFSGGALCALELAHYPLRILAMNALPPAQGPEEPDDTYRQRWLERVEATPAWIVKWLEEQHDGPYWRNGSLRPDPSRIRCPVLIVAGWRDGYRTAMLRLASSLSAPWQLLAGPWMHTAPDSGIPGPPYPFMSELAAWFRHHLGGEGPRKARPRMVFFMTEFDAPSRPPREVSGRWLASDRWPDEAGPATVLHLRDSQELGPEPSGREVAVTPSFGPSVGVASGNWCPPPPGHGLPSDQRTDEARSAVFTSEPLAEPLEVLGAAALRVRVDHPGPSALVVAKLADVSPAGESQLVTSGVLNLAHRNGHERPEPIYGPVDVEVALQATGWRFRAGHRIRLAVAGSDWPTVWPLPTNHPVTLCLGGGAPSTLELPGLPTDAQPYRPPATLVEDPESEGWRHRPNTSTWRIVTDAMAGTSGIEASDSWRAENADDDVRVGETRRYQAFVGEDDPLSARVSGEATFRLERPGLFVRSTARGRFASTAESFTYDVRLDVREGGEVVHRHRWRGEVPRHLC